MKREREEAVTQGVRGNIWENLEYRKGEGGGREASVNVNLRGGLRGRVMRKGGEEETDKVATGS